MKAEGTADPKFQKVVKYIQRQKKMKTQALQQNQAMTVAPTSTYGGRGEGGGRGGGCGGGGGNTDGSGGAGAGEAGGGGASFTPAQLSMLQEQIQQYKHLRQSLDDVTVDINRQTAAYAVRVAEAEQQRRAEDARNYFKQQQLR